MMERLRAMIEPLKYVQGRDALLNFQEEMGYMGHRWLFVCSNSGYKACHDKIEKSFGDSDDTEGMRFLAAFQARARSLRWKRSSRKTRSM